MPFSPWDWNKRIPRDFNENLKYRKTLLDAAEHDERLQKALIEVCKNDILFFINLFGYQFNPDLREEGPFICRVDQEKILLGGEVEVAAGITKRQYGLLECVEDREDVRCPKSRYVGFTWLICFMAVYLGLFHENVKGLIMSKDEDTAEDVDNQDSIFWKILFILDHLPDWLRRGADKKKRGIIIFPSTNNTVTSTANVESAGVGGRATYLIADEFGQFRKGHEIYSMTKDTSGCRIFVGTHKGRGTMLYSLCRGPLHEEMREIVTHWSHDPEKRKGLYRTNVERGWEVIDKQYEFPESFIFVTDSKPSGGPFPFMRSPWYDKQCKGRTEYDVAMNLDVDPDGSQTSFFPGFEISVLKEQCREPIWRGKLEYDREKGAIKRVIPDPRGPLKLWVNWTGELQLPKMRAGAAGDVARGTAETPSCFSMFNADVGEKIMSYEDAKIYDIDFAAVCAGLCRLVKDAKGTHPLLTWEVQGGQAFGKRINELGYYHVYRAGVDETQFVARAAPKLPGWSAMPNAKLKLLIEYRDALTTRIITNWDEHALDETLHFAYTGNSVRYVGMNKGKVKDTDSGASVHHGDIVMADALAYKMICELGFNRPTLLIAVASKIPEPRTSGFREWLGEHQRDDEEIWA